MPEWFLSLLLRANVPPRLKMKKPKIYVIIGFLFCNAQVYSLLDAVEQALSHNLPFRQAELSFANQQTELQLALKQFFGVFPSVSLSYLDARGVERSESVRLDALQKFPFGGSLQFVTTSSHSAFPLSYSSRVGITFSFPFGEAGGRRFTLLGVETARWTFLQNEIDFWLKRQEIIQGAVAVYLSAWQAKQNWKIRQDTLKQSELLLDLNRTKYELGLIAEPEFLRAQVNYENAQVDVLSAERAYRNALENLAQFLGFPPDTPIDVEEEISFPLPERPSEEETLQKVYKQNPILRRLSYQQKIRELNLWASRRKILPEGSVTVNYSLDSTGTDFEAGSRLDTYTISAGVSFRLPLRTTIEQLQYEQTRRSYQAFLIDAEETRRSVVKDVSQRLRIIAEGLATLKILEKSLRNAENSFRLIQESYSEGLATILDFQSEQQRLAQIRLQNVSARVNLLNNFIALQKDLGEDAWVFLKNLFLSRGEKK
ncbi:MAG: TolC family protein [bacterium JZ-2024 1]